MNVEYKCKYLKYRCTKGNEMDGRYVCQYKEEADILTYSTIDGDREYMYDLPNCPGDIRRDENGNRICYIIKKSDTERKEK